MDQEFYKNRKLLENKLVKFIIYPDCGEFDPEIRGPAYSVLDVFCNILKENNISLAK